MYTIFFANAVITDAVNTRQCQCTDYWDALAVWDALSRRYLVVELWDNEGNKLRAYNNLF